MLLIPAIDIKGGQCVRLRQGRMQEATVFGDDPVQMAARWLQAGARRLHVVDLDGAMTGEPVNAKVIQRITEICGEVPVQIGGGIRNEETAEAYLDAGAGYVIIGTKAVSAPHFVGDLCVAFPGRVIVGLDARDGRVATEGWSKLSNHDVVDLAQQFEREGVAAIVYTDIRRDGTMEGVNVEATRRLASAVAVPVIASGGVASIEDVRALAAIEADGVSGMILGRALYEGALDLAEAQRLVDA